MNEQIPMNPGQVFQAYIHIQEGHKLKAVKKIKEWTGWGLKQSKEFADDITDYIDTSKVGQAKVLANSLTLIEDGIAQETVGFSLREIEEPTGYIAVDFNSLNPINVVYHSLICSDKILHKKGEKYYVGVYFRFKKDIPDVSIYEEILKL